MERVKYLWCPIVMTYTMATTYTIYYIIYYGLYSYHKNKI